MALSGLDIYKLLPKTNCKECGFATCLAFAMQLAKKAVAIDKCPYISEEAKKVLEASSLPPIKLITVGVGEEALRVGNENVLFRHEEKFFNPCGIGFIIDDSETDAQIKEKLEAINHLKFERVGQELKPNLIALRNTKDAARFTEAAKIVSQGCSLGIVLMSRKVDALAEALKIVGSRKPLLYAATKENVLEIAQLANAHKVAVAVSASSLDEISLLTKELTAQGASDLVLDIATGSIVDKVWGLTQVRRQALKKSNRSLGYPTIAIVEDDDPFRQAVEAATYICKYAGIVLVKGTDIAQTLSLLTLRQNIYTDPQKPLQIESKLYSVGQAGKTSPVLVTTNFSLTYYTVLGEVEASKVPTFILTIDTEGMSVLTAWAAEKFTPVKIADSLAKYKVPDAVTHKRLVIPGYVAVISGELEDKSGWQVMVGPKEAAGIPSFLKNLGEVSR